MVGRADAFHLASLREEGGPKLPSHPFSSVVVSLLVNVNLPLDGAPDAGRFPMTKQSLVALP